MSGLSGDNFGLTPEDLEKCKRRVPVGIFDITELTQFQRDNIKGGMIRADLLTGAQLERVEEALAFDYELSLTRCGFAGNTDTLVNSGGKTEGV